MLTSKEEKTTANWMKEAHKGYIRVAALIIINKKPAHGYEIMKEIREKTGGFWTPTAGGVYPILSDLEKSGYISGVWQIQKNRKLKSYSITDSGRQILERAVIRQNEIGKSMAALFTEFARDVLNVEIESPLPTSLFSPFLENGKTESDIKKLERQRSQIQQQVKMMQERLKAIESKLAEAKQAKKEKRKAKNKLSAA